MAFDHILRVCVYSCVRRDERVRACSRFDWSFSHCIHVSIIGLIGVIKSEATFVRRRYEGLDGV